MGCRKCYSLFVFFIIGLLMVFVLSCSNPTNPADSSSDFSPKTEANRVDNQTGVLEVYLTDWPLQGKSVANLWISVERIDIHGDATGWYAVVPQTDKFDLLKLVDDVSLVGIYELPADYYTQIRLILGPENYIVFDDSESIALTIPSGQQTGIKIVGGFELSEGYKVRIVLDFDAEKSVKLRGRAKNTDDPGKLFLKPVIKIKEVALEPLTNELYPRIVIDTHSPNGSLTADTYIDLFDASGDPDADDPWSGDDAADSIASANDGNPDFADMARIDYTGGLPPGTYYIRVRGASETVHDLYAIRVVSLNPGDALPHYDFQPLEGRPDSYETAPGDDEPKSGGVPLNPVSIDLGQTISRSIDYDSAAGEGDIDWFVLELK